MAAFINELSFAHQLDAQDPLKQFRSRFVIPQRDGRDQIYFLGNSLGLQPVTTRDAINQVLDQWSSYGVEGFFHGNDPWMNLHDQLTGPLAEIVGALPTEVVVMNQLSVNLHLMLVSFYRPAGKKQKIICEAKAFPSDQYMLETHLRHLGLEPDQVIIEVSPRPGEFEVRAEDLLEAIAHHREELSLVFIGGINYYTGQVFDMQKITTAAHEAGAKIGLDLAHAAGNVRLALHDWNVDFACWCSYKYLNSGPGAVGGAFVHERYHHDSSLVRFAGWWGHDKATRFEMSKGFVPVSTAEGWQLSTPSMLLYASHLAALMIFKEAGMDRILTKSALLSEWLFFLVTDLAGKLMPGQLQIITPAGQGHHGSQLSMLIPEKGRQIHSALTDNSVFADWREPDVIRIAPVPLYNTFTEVYQFVQLLKAAFNA